MQAGRSTSADFLIIRPRKPWSLVELSELWRFRDLLWLLAARDVRVRYKQAVLGVLWAVLQPLLTMAIFAIFFGHLGGFAKQVPGGVPYTAYTFCALLPWQLFSHSLTSASNSLIENQNLITKVYFPRIIIPLSSVLVGLLDFGIAMLLLLAILIWYGLMPTVNIALLPVFVVMAIISAMSVGIWLAALNAQYRDFRYTIPFITQVWLFASPVAYPTTFVPEKWQAVYSLNPMVGVIEGFRWCILQQGSLPTSVTFVSLGAATLMLIAGMAYFRRVERTLADRV